MNEESVGGRRIHAACLGLATRDGRRGCATHDKVASPEKPPSPARYGAPVADALRSDSRLPILTRHFPSAPQPLLFVVLYPES